MLAQLECPRGQAHVLFYLVLVLVLHSAAQVEVSQVAGVAPSQQHLEVQQATVASGVASWLLHHQRLVLEHLAAPPQQQVELQVVAQHVVVDLAHLLQCCYHPKPAGVVPSLCRLRGRRPTFDLTFLPQQLLPCPRCTCYHPKQLVHCWVHNWRCCYHHQWLVLPTTILHRHCSHVP